MELTKKEVKFLKDEVKHQSENTDCWSDWETAKDYFSCSKKKWIEEKLILIGLCKKFKIVPKWNPQKF